jgi:uncharacterized HAD superfamily protein
MKTKLLGILDEPANKLIAVDLDGTLCEGEFWGNGDPKPKKDLIDYFNSLYMKGAHIIIYTARRAEFARETFAWLDKHAVLYHGVMMQKKPGADVYIDDKALNIDDLGGVL